MKRKTFGVIGIGRFGLYMAKTLAENKAEVIACDIEEEPVKEISDFISKSYILDATNEKALKEAGFHNLDTVIVSIGENIEASILTVMQLLKLGVKEIIAKAITSTHGMILEKIGISKIVYPEKNVAIRIAHTLLYEGFIDETPFANEYSIFEIKCPAQFIHKKLNEIDLRNKFDISILSIKRDSSILVNPSAEETIVENDHLLILGKLENVKKLIT
ncbi:TrkA family potassium uptake protein [bacterium]|nr:TrkA family potassium uptake protein [bacterium]